MARNRAMFSVVSVDEQGEIGPLVVSMVALWIYRCEEICEEPGCCSSATAGTYPSYGSMCVLVRQARGCEFKSLFV